MRPQPSRQPAEQGCHFVSGPPTGGAGLFYTTLDAVPLDMLQFHGDESPGECESYQRPYIKALRVKAGDDIAAACDAYTGARGILLDTYVEGVPGGTGEAFDWSLIPEGLSKPIILAGGLNPANVGAAIEQVRPYAVDVVLHSGSYGRRQTASRHIPTLLSRTACMNARILL